MSLDCIIYKDFNIDFQKPQYGFFYKSLLIKTTLIICAHKNMQGMKCCVCCAVEYYHGQLSAL
jgi:hypothetical protein